MKAEQGGFTLITIFGIQDIMREEVPGAIAQVGIAGVMVRMVTGDNLVTAKAIAIDCGIINAQQMEDEVCMEGPKFHDLVQGLSCATCNQVVPFDCACHKDDRKEVVTNTQAFKQIKDKLRVLARSRPEDKYLLVTFRCRSCRKRRFNLWLYILYNVIERHRIRGILRWCKSEF